LAEADVGGLRLPALASTMRVVLMLGFAEPLAVRRLQKKALFKAFFFLNTV